MTEALQRRTVLAGSGIVLASFAVAACSSGAESAEPSASATAAPEEPITDEQGGGAVLAATSAVAVGGGVIVSSPPIVVTQPTAGQFNGFTAICPHQGCLVSRVEDNEIICPCHGSRFSATDGSVINGPAEVGLSSADVAVEGSNVVLA